MDEDPVHSLTAAYALDALPPAERRAFEAHLPSCPSCHRDLAAFRATAVALARAVPPGEAPAALLARVRAEAARTPQTAAPRAADRRPAAAPGPGPAVGAGPQAAGTGTAVGGTGEPGPGEERGAVPRPRRRWAGAALAAALVAVVGLGGVSVWQHREADRARAEVRQAQAAAAGVAEVLAAPDVRVSTEPLTGRATGTLAVSERQDAAVFLAHDLPPLPARQAYQLWYGEADGRYRPAGLLPRSGDAQQLRLTGPVSGATLVCITVEPAAGAARPTPPVLARLPLPASPSVDPPAWPPEDTY
ncbi:anti-sigma factor [Streptomyces sp. NPDC089919]|uniref:anti-sigma factor domain-containing protein n=1 Tax=Streptomyces sp. NPDC089919 TaxID=3155188 RepID=UPI00343A3FF3